MVGFPVGLSILLVISILIFFGLAHRVLDRLYLTDKTALLVIVLMAVGSFIDIPLGARGSINIGGGLIPIALALYVLFRAGSSWEWIRCILAVVITAGALFLANRFIGAEPETMFLDPLYAYPIIAGLIAYIAGRSRRGAFIAATLGIVMLDIGSWIWYGVKGIPGKVAIGGAGVFDTIVVAGVIAVLLAELIGETRERLQGGPSSEDRHSQLLENLRGSSLRAKLQPLPEKKPYVKQSLNNSRKTENMNGEANPYFKNGSEDLFQPENVSDKGES